MVESRERERGGESESRVYLCCSCAGSCQDKAMVVLVGRCSISIIQLYRSYKEVYSAYGVCVMMGGEIYILVFDTLSMVVIIGMYDLSVEVDLYTYI